MIALGPGFTAGVDCHLVIETNRGHDLGRIIASGSAEPNTGVPGDIAGHTDERVLRAPAAGTFDSQRAIGDSVRRNDVIGQVAGQPVTARLDGMLRGLIRPGTAVTAGLKLGDIDPRAKREHCDTISDKARAIAGAALEAVMRYCNRPGLDEMLIEALGLERSHLISLCGAGGKTTLMFSLAREFVAAGERVLVTTTTKIARDEADGWRFVRRRARTNRCWRMRARCCRKADRVRAGAVIAYSRVGGDGHRLVGLAPELVDEVAQAGLFDRILVEADGSARKPLKAPAAHEPVIPSATQALLIVAGMNGLGLPLSEDNLFRAEIWSRLSGLASAFSHQRRIARAHAWRIPTGSPAAVPQAPEGYCSSIRRTRRSVAPRRSGSPNSSPPHLQRRWSGW